MLRNDGERRCVLAPLVARTFQSLQEKHSSEMQKFEMNVTCSYSNDAMLRQISEGVRIDKVPEGSLMNSKNEWNYFRVPRAMVARDHVK